MGEAFLKSVSIWNGSELTVTYPRLQENVMFFMVCFVFILDLLEPCGTLIKNTNSIK